MEKYLIFVLFFLKIKKHSCTQKTKSVKIYLICVLNHHEILLLVSFFEK